MALSEPAQKPAVCSTSASLADHLEIHVTPRFSANLDDQQITLSHLQIVLIIRWKANHLDQHKAKKSRSLLPHLSSVVFIAFWLPLVSHGPANRVVTSTGTDCLLFCNFCLIPLSWVSSRSWMRISCLLGLKLSRTSYSFTPR